MTDGRWLTDHLLGEDDPELHEASAHRIATDPELARRAAELRGVITRLSELPPDGWRAAADRADLPPVSADALAAERIDEPANYRRPPTQSDNPAVSSRSKRRRRRRAVALAAFVFLAGMAVDAIIRSTVRNDGGAIRYRVALRPLRFDSTAQGEAALTRDGHLRLTFSGLPRAGRGDYYEAWLMTSPQQLVPLATFQTRGRSASVNVIPPTPVTRYRYIDISLQNRAHGLGHSRESVLRGSTGKAG